MNRMEKASLHHVAEWMRYSKSPQYLRDLKADIAQREAIDRKAGHSPKCGLLKCHPSCGTLRCS